MTDSRVTPQAAAKERKHVALTAATYALWRYDYRGQTAEWFDGHHPEKWHWERAEAALAAAVPLLCQPLQDEIDRLRAEHRDLTRRLEFGDGITEPQADNDTIVAWVEQESSDAAEWRESQRWRADCYQAGHPDDEDCAVHDPSLRLERAEAEVERLRAQIEAARAAFAERFGPVETFAEPFIPPVDDTTAALIRIADALAAVPVGTGGAE